MAIDESIAQILRDAHETVKAAAVPAALQAAAFEQAVHLLAARVGVPTGVSAPTLVAQNPPPLQKTEPNEERSLARVAEKLKVDPEVVGEVFHVDDGELALSFGTAKLPTAKSTAAKQIALLVAAARQAGGWDAEWTEAAQIRTTCESYGKFDQSNFAGALGAMVDQFSFNGTGPGRKVKLKRKGYEDAAELVKSIAGEG